MQGNIFYAFQVIIFMFFFFFFECKAIKKKVPEKYKSDRIEIMGCSCLVSLIVVFLTTIFSMNYLETLYYDAWFLFWFTYFAIAMCLADLQMSFSLWLLHKLKLA